MGERYIMVFVSNSQAAYIYNELEKNSISVELVSTPAEILSGCTKSIIYNKTYNDIVIKEVSKIKARTKGIYSIESENKYIKI
jgi:hypothetical protein